MVVVICLLLWGLMNERIGCWFFGGVVRVDILWMLVMVIFSVCGMGVVFMVRMLMLVFSFLSVFLCLMLNCCFLLMIIRFRFLKMICLVRMWCVLIIMLIVLLRSFCSVSWIFLLVWNCDSVCIFIGKFVKCFVNVFMCCLIRSVVGMSIVICLLFWIVLNVVCIVILVLLKFMLLESSWFIGIGCFMLVLILLIVCSWFCVFVNGNVFFSLCCQGVFGLNVCFLVFMCVEYSLMSLIVMLWMVLWVLFLVCVQLLLFIFDRVGVLFLMYLERVLSWLVGMKSLLLGYLCLDGVYLSMRQLCIDLVVLCLFVEILCCVIFMNWLMLCVVCMMQLFCFSCSGLMMFLCCEVSLWMMCWLLLMVWLQNLLLVRMVSFVFGIWKLVLIDLVMSVVMLVFGVFLSDLMMWVVMF